MQSVLAITLCVVISAWLGSYYLVPALVATLIAVTTGVYIAAAIALGFVWPVLAVAYVMHVTSDAKLRAYATHHGAGRSPAERGVLGVEDPQQREH